jgi:hypothetical protein
VQAYTQASDAESMCLSGTDSRWRMVLDRLDADEDEPAFSQGGLLSQARGAAPAETDLSVRALASGAAPSGGTRTARLEGGNVGVASRPWPNEGTRGVRARLDWADLLRRTFAIEVLQCGRCGGKRRVLAHVTGTGVEAILDHLGLPSRSPRLARARGPPEPSWLD